MKWPFTRRTKEAGWLALALEPDGLSYVHGQLAPGGPPVIDRCGFDAGELDAQRFQCSTLLGPGQYQLLMVEAPNVPPSELRTAIRWRIKDMLDYHVDDATVDVLAVPTKGPGGERSQSMYAVTARNEVVLETIRRFEAAQIPLSVIDIPETAQRNVAALFEPEDRGVALLHLGQEQALLTINFRRELLLSRRIDVGVDALAQAGGGERQDHLERILLELQRTFDHLDRQFAYAPVAKLLLAPEPEDTGLLEHLAANLDLPVERLHLAGALSCGAGAERDAAGEWRLFHLIGARLRHESKAL
jgi:MSHA biogenesis protein MshI